MTSTFAIQPIPPFKPKQHTAPSPLLPILTQSLSSSTPPSASLPTTSTSNDTGQPRRFSTTGVTAGNGNVYPSVFEIPNPRKSSHGGTKGIDSHRGLSGVIEVEVTGVNSNKRRASDEVEGERSESGNGSRRGSGETSNDANNERRGSNESIRSSFSIPANPHPRPPQLVTRTSAPTITSPPFRNSPSPNSTRDRQLYTGNQDRESPNPSSKRARTSMGTLESLATTASNLLSSSTSSVSSSSSTPPTTASSSNLNNVLGPPSNAQTREHQTALETSRNMREQQQREIERRRIASGGTNQPTPGSVAAALGKLRDNPRYERGDSEMVEGAGGGSGTGLAKRRGHRPPAVSTGSFPPSSSNPLAINSSTRSSAYEEAMRSAPPGIPSVLVGSPVEASWAARVGKEANVGSARVGGGGTPTNASNSRRQSTSAMNAAYPSVREPYPNPTPIRTTTRPGHHSHHAPPASSQSMSASHSKERHQPSMTLNPPHSAPYAASPNSHPLSLHPSSQGPGTRLPSLNQIVQHPPYNPPRLSPPQQSYHSNHHQPPPPSPTPNSASKSAFLSLFSTFFDSLQDSRVLTNTLDQQISRAGTLLQTLQQSETVLEQLVDRKLVDAERRLMESVERRYEGRLERLENELMKKSIPMEERDGFVGLGIMDQSSQSSRTPTSSSFPSSSSTTEDRLNKLERLLLEKEDFGEREGSGEKSLPTPHEERENGVSRAYGAGGSEVVARGAVRGVVDERDT